MSATIATASVVAGTDSTISLGALFSVSSTALSPEYLILSILDRDEYAGGSQAAQFGTLFGDGTAEAFNHLTADGLGTGSDAYTVSVLFTLGSDGIYSNATLGTLANLTFTTGSFATDNVSFSLFTTNNGTLATDYAADTYVLAVNPSYFTYEGSVSVVTEPAAAAPPPQATPNGIAAAASSFIGASWNANGCWTLASNIAAEAGASLPVVTALADEAGVANGEWIVAYNGPVSSSSNYKKLLAPGEMVVFAHTTLSNGTTSVDGGHIATVVSGFGTAAEVVDNTVFVSGGHTVNASPDGNTNDIVVQAPHSATQELAGVGAAYVVIYELDTPLVSAVVAQQTVAPGSTLKLDAHVFTASVPLTSESVTEWQIADSKADDALIVAGTTHAGAGTLTIAGAVTSTSGTTTSFALPNVTLLAGGLTGTDSIELRAFNGSYWGDWVAFDAVDSSSCFLTGTRVATPDGEQRVETLRAGDLVGLAGGGAAPVRWIGRQTLSRRFADPARTWPIRISAGALGPGVPHTDLLLSPGHAVFVGGVLALASALVDGTTIRREPPAGESFIYWHLELDRHALILAEGAAVESYLDAHGELPFDNRADRPAPPADAGELPYPRCKSPRQVPRAVRVWLSRLRPALAATG